MTALDLLKKYWKPLACGLAFLAAFACGRFLVPTHVVTKTVVQTVTKTVTVEGKERVVYKDRVVFKDRTVIRYKDGTVEQRDVERTGESEGQRDTTTAVKETEKDSVRIASKVSDSPKAQWHISALAGVDVSHLDPPAFVFGAHAERRIAGPFWAGAWGLSSGVVGLSLGLEF